jgi:hypothetical protein
MTLIHRAALAALAVTGLLVAMTAQAAESADECVAVQRAEQSNGLQFEVKNNCDRRLSCSLTWRLSCENASGKVTSSATKVASFVVAASSEHQVFGSAAACASNWRIDDVSWECAPATK